MNWQIYFRELGKLFWRNIPVFAIGYLCLIAFNDKKYFMDIKVLILTAILASVILLPIYSIIIFREHSRKNLTRSE